MLEFVDAVGAMDPDYDESETEVTCEGFSGTAEELRAHVLGDAGADAQN